MDVNTLKVSRKKEYQKRRESKSREQEHQAQEQLKTHLRSAAQAIGIKRMGLELPELSFPEQVSLLERYAEKLSGEIQAYWAKWGAAGRDGVTWIIAERTSVLSSLARTRIQQLKAEHEPRRKNPYE